MFRILALTVLATGSLFGQAWGSYSGKPVARISFLRHAFVNAAQNPFRDSSLTGFWPLSDTDPTTVRSSSGTTDTGTWNGGSGHYAPGYTSKWAAHFNGTDNYVQFSAPDNFTGDYTVAFWYTIETDINLETLIANQQSTSPFPQFSYCINDFNHPGITQQFQFSGGGTDDQQPDVSYGTWHFAAWTFSNSTTTMTIYADGTQYNQYTGNSGLLTSTTNMAFGMNPAVGSRFLQGAMENVRFYNRELSASEIAAIYHTEANK